MAKQITERQIEQIIEKLVDRVEQANTEYLKSIGTYQKINNYQNTEWDSEFNKKVLERFNTSSLITGEYLTYNCKDKNKILIRS